MVEQRGRVEAGSHESAAAAAGVCGNAASAFDVRMVTFSDVCHEVGTPAAAVGGRCQYGRTHSAAENIAVDTLTVSTLGAASVWSWANRARRVGAS